tara:strand:- start:209 stop:511 length:303 start_codon:yes stop_codon:yes gene_type:complete
MMTKKQMQDLADMITSKIIIELFGDAKIRSKAMDNFHREREEDVMGIGHIFPDLSNEELLIGELARLQTILMIYEDREEYEKAARILKKLRLIQKELGGM